MKFYGEVDSGGNNVRVFGKTIFNSEKKVIVFDIDDLLLLYKRNYNRGKEAVGMRRVLHSQARGVVGRALVDFDRVVFWTGVPGSLAYLNGHPFDDVHQRIEGGIPIGGKLIKDLGMISRNYNRKVVAMQDGEEEITFEPMNRVVQVAKTDDLMRGYGKAREMVV